MNKLSKIIWSLVSGFVCVIYRNDIIANANAAGYTTYSDCSNANQSQIQNHFYSASASEGCDTLATEKCYHCTGGGFDMSITNCSSCKSGYTKVTKNTEGGCPTFSYCVISCPAGQYAFSSSECEDCPTPGTSDASNNTSIFKCYIPSNTAKTDWGGTYEFTDKCFYTDSQA